MTRHLYINADDYGSDITRSCGIAIAAIIGAVSSTSILIIGISSFEVWMASLLRKYMGLRIGLHIDITSQTLLTTTNTTLILNDPVFQDKRDMWTALINGTANYNAIKAEITAQLDKFKENFGTYPDFIDTHNHVHVANKEIYTLCHTIGKKYDAPLTRIPYEYPIEGKSALSKEIMADLSSFIKTHQPCEELSLIALVEKMRSSRVADILLYKNCVQKLLEAGIVSTHSLESNAFYGTLYGHTRKFTDLLDLYQRVLRSNSIECEIMVHPGLNIFTKKTNRFSDFNRFIELVNVILLRLCRVFLKS